MSQITTHVLDTSKGSPAEGIQIKLQKPIGTNEWEDITSGITNSDGRITGFLDDNMILEPGRYRMEFMTGEYFNSTNTQGFYPYVHIVFEIQDTEHYHIPLLLNPYGYSTYRGS